MERATVQNLTGGTVRILGGTIIGVNQQAISNEGTLTIGSKDGSVSTTAPSITGKTYGVKSTSTFNFYDGIIRGRTDSINGTVSDVETNYQVANDTVTEDGVTYHTACLEPIE